MLPTDRQQTERVGCRVACTRLKINILRADHVVGLSQASIEINIGFEILLSGGHALPSIILIPIGNPKFQNTQIPILSADLESAEKTDN